MQVLSAANKSEGWVGSVAHRLSRKRCLDQCLPPLVQHVHWEPRQGERRRQAVGEERCVCVFVCVCVCCVCVCVRVCVCACTECKYTHTYVGDYAHYV